MTDSSYPANPRSPRLPGQRGDPDAWRGGTVRAHVSLRPGTSVGPEEPGAYCKERLAAYKHPREVEILAELPKTASGKILGRGPRSPR